MTEPTYSEPAPDRRERTDWRQREGARKAIDTGTVIWGLILIGVGGWFFLDHTLGMDMPRIAWGDLWPVVLLVVGAAVILQGLGRRSS